MRTSIATVCISGSLEEKMRAAAEVGFDGVEIFEQDLMTSPLSPEQVVDLAEELDLSLDLYQPFRDLEGVSEEVFADNLYRIEEKFRLMQRLGMDLMLVCSNVVTATEWTDHVAVDQLGRAADVAAKYGVRLAYEALAWGRYINTYEHAWSIVEQADRPNLGVCLDSFHILSRRSDPSGFATIPAEKIFFLQLADAPEMMMDLLSWSRHYRNFPGEGSFDLVNFMVELTRAGYAGPVSLEIFNDVFRQTDVVRTTRDAYRSLIWLADATCAALPSAGIDPDTAANTMGLKPLEPVAAPTGWDYAEVKAQETEEITTLLTQLGFTDRGMHRTKDVRLFASGDARIVLNDLPDGATGPVIAGMGFQLPEPKIAANRARHLQIPTAHRANRADEMVLRGVLAPDGTEVFFSPEQNGTEPGWLKEFGDPNQQPGAHELISGLDHVNLAQPWQYFDEAILFYTAAFGLETQPPADVASPQGLVRSQVMRTADGTIRMPLNMVPQVLDVAPTHNQGSEQTVTGNHVQMRRSAYPQHLAFATDDIIGLAQNAATAGLRFLPVPDNYYEDLQARFRLDEEFLHQLQQHHLLYDRDPDGEFLHFYTRTVGTVFFEVVERRSGYNGYGAPNAPVRMAAQYALERY